MVFVDPWFRDLLPGPAHLRRVKSCLINYSPEVAEQVNKLAKRRIIQLLEDYQHNGDQALGTYRDKRDPLPVTDQYRSLLSRVELFPQYLSGLNRYLEYPNSRPEGDSWG